MLTIIREVHYFLNTLVIFLSDWLKHSIIYNKVFYTSGIFVLQDSLTEKIYSFYLVTEINLNIKILNIVK